MQIMRGGKPMMTSKGKEQEKAIEELVEGIKVFEEGIKNDFPGKFPSFKGHDESLGVMDVIVGSNACNYKAFNEVFGEIGRPERNPDFFSWVNILKEHPLIKETLPPHHKMVDKLKQYLLFFQSPTAS